MRGDSRVAQPVSPRQKLDPAPTPDYPARPTRLRLKTTADSVDDDPHHVEWDTVVEDIGFNVSAPITDIMIPRKGLWFVYMYALIPNTAEASWAPVENTGTGTIEEWTGSFLTSITPSSLGGSAPTTDSRTVFFDVAQGNTVEFYLQIQSLFGDRPFDFDGILNIERISYGGTLAIT